MRILLIEDSAAYREEFSVLLADAKIQHSALDFAATAAEGARLMAAGAHDLYVIDYRLPGGDGLALVRNAREAGMIVPIIVLTGYGNPAVDEAAEAAGATDFLPKGEFSPQILSRAIRYALRNASALRAAREAESRFRMAQEVAGIGTWDWNIRANTKIWSASMWKLYGRNSDDSGAVAPDTWRLALHPNDREKAQAALAAAILGETRYDLVFRILRPNPENPAAQPVLRWIAAKGEVLRDANGAPYRMLGINMDVTDQQNAIAALEAEQNVALSGLQASERRFQTYFESAVECQFHVRRDDDGAFRYVILNPFGLRRIGKTRDEVIGRTPIEVFGPEAGAIMIDGFQRVYETGQLYHFEPTYTMQGKTAVWDANYVPLRNEAGEVIGVLGSARDITERRNLEATLLQAQKMEALGQLAGGVAHDFNNLLTGMLGCFELLARQVTTERGKRLAAQGVRAVERSTALTARLLSFARQQALTTEPVDINASLEEITEMLSRTLGADVRIGKDLAPDLWLANTDHNQVELAILNLGINARDAMPMGGTLTILTRNATVAEPLNGIAVGDYATIVITDTGSGMTPEVLARVTEPFFTTKPPGKGTGLGLSMVAGVVKQLGGGLSIASEPGKGTSVTLFLPRASVEAPAARRDLPDGPLGSACLLLVDDDPDTQTAVAAYATEAGHSVVTACNAREALAVLDAGGEVDMVIIDSTLPGMSCTELVAQALRRQPGLPILFISGQTKSAEIEGIPVLSKPFRQDAFNNALRRLIGDRKPSGTVVQMRRSNGAEKEPQ